MITTNFFKYLFKIFTVFLKKVIKAKTQKKRERAEGEERERRQKEKRKRAEGEEEDFGWKINFTQK